MEGEHKRRVPGTFFNKSDFEYKSWTCDQSSIFLILYYVLYHLDPVGLEMRSKWTEVPLCLGAHIFLT